MQSGLMIVVAFIALAGQRSTSSATRSLAADTATVQGVVFDSLAMSPLSGALIQMVPSDPSAAPGHYAAKSDSLGRFLIRGVPAGEYVIGFYHLTLDTLGIELPNRRLTVMGREFVTALGTPSAATLIATFCGAQGPNRSAGSRSSLFPTLLIGHVRDVRTEVAVESALVSFSWADVDWTAKGPEIVDRNARAQTGGGGFFAVCGLPPEVPLSAATYRATDSSGHIALRVPPAGFLHVTLAMGAGGRRGRVVGRITDTAKRPLGKAHVAIGNRLAATNDDGSFLIDSVGVGSQSIVVRALGYAPRLDILQVAEGRPTEFAVTLERVVALPAVVSNESAAAANLAQYLHEKRSDASGAMFVEPTRIPGYKSQQSACQLIRAATRVDYCRTDRPFFCPAIFVNGVKTRLRIEDIEPDDIIGVEGFGHSPPARYAGIKQVCPFVIWTRCSGSTLPTCEGDSRSRLPADRRRRDHAEETFAVVFPKRSDL
jgi:hypothetical protein